MLHSFEIKNFRNLKELKLASLARINLITGKNNTGKSTLLEAVSLFSSKASLGWIYQLLNERGEDVQNVKSLVESNIKVFSSLFTNRNVGFSSADAIYLGPVQNTLPDANDFTKEAISIGFVKYLEESFSDKNDAGNFISRKRKIVATSKDWDNSIDYLMGLEIKEGGKSSLLPLERPFAALRGPSALDSFQFIRTRNIDRDVNSRLWDTIALTDKENFVTDALRIIEPEIERITFVSNEENSRIRNAVIKIKNNNNIVPLKSMGDGINRILTIILALVNADNGYLLIDEFENGLHYSVQEKLWNIVFFLAKELNIQVFATTHSNDCIASFENVLNEQKEVSHQGKLIRLDIVNDIIKQVEYDAEELKIATDLNIETR